MFEWMEKFIQRAPFATVLWQLRENGADQDFYMLSYNKIANDLDRRNYELFLDKPYKLGFSEALAVRDAFFQALTNQETIGFDEYEHIGLRSEPEYFRIWIVPLDDSHIVIMYENITAYRRINVS